MRKNYAGYHTLGILTFIILVYLVSLLTAPSNTDTPQPYFTTNEEFIEGLYSTLNTSDRFEVLSFVFDNLDEEVDVYPGENFYYFKFVANGKVYGGTMGLSTRDRDDGVLHFGYIARPEYPRKDVYKKSDDSGGGQLTEEDGVFIEKVDNFTYDVTYDSKTIRFHLSQPLLAFPKKAQILESEHFIGPVFDDSGLTFHLVFNKAFPHMYHVLNEDGTVPEQFDQITHNILIGERTEFAFYNDQENNRKILIGVEASHVLNNDWYDGPFDHMPDNYIATGEIEFQKYVEAAYPGTAGRIDEHSRYLDRNGTRVAIAPYIVYYDRVDLTNRVQQCKSYNFFSPDAFYECITRQEFRGP